MYSPEPRSDVYCFMFKLGSSFINYSHILLSSFILPSNANVFYFLFYHHLSGFILYLHGIIIIPCVVNQMKSNAGCSKKYRVNTNHGLAVYKNYTLPWLDNLVLRMELCLIWF